MSFMLRVSLTVPCDPASVAGRTILQLFLRKPIYRKTSRNPAESSPRPARKIIVY